MRESAGEKRAAVPGADAAAPVEGSPAAGPAAAAIATPSRDGPAPVAPTADPSPDFFREVWREVVSFVETLWGALSRPSSFSRAWTRGQREAMNPLAFFGVCVSLGAGAEILQRRLTGLPEPERSWWMDLAGPNLWLAGVAVYGLYLHWDLRRHGYGLSPRAAVGVTLFSAGAVSFSSDALEQLFRIVYWWRAHGALRANVLPLFFGGLLLQAIWLTRALHGATSESPKPRTIWQLADDVWGIKTFLKMSAIGIGMGTFVLFALLFFFLGKEYRGGTKQAEESARRSLTQPSAQAEWDRLAARPRAAAPQPPTQAAPIPAPGASDSTSDLFQGGVDGFRAGWDSVVVKPRPGAPPAQAAAAPVPAASATPAPPQAAPVPPASAPAASTEVTGRR